MYKLDIETPSWGSATVTATATTTARQSFIFRGTLVVSLNRSMLTQYWHNWASDGRTKGNRFDNFLVLRQSQLHYARNKAMHTEGGGEAGDEFKMAWPMKSLLMDRG